MVTPNKGAILTILRGSNQYRALIISGDAYTAHESVPLWALSIVRDAPPRTSGLFVQLGDQDPLRGSYVRIPGVMQILDRTAIRDPLGSVTTPTMRRIETALRLFLDLP